MTYNEAMLIAIRSSDGNMDSVNSIAQSLMHEVNEIQPCEIDEYEQFQKEHGLGWYEYY